MIVRNWFIYAFLGVKPYIHDSLPCGFQWSCTIGRQVYLSFGFWLYAYTILSDFELMSQLIYKLCSNTIWPLKVICLSNSKYPKQESNNFGQFVSLNDFGWFISLIDLLKLWRSTVRTICDMYLRISWSN